MDWRVRRKRDLHAPVMPRVGACEQITGHARLEQCHGCRRSAMVGSVQYEGASTGRLLDPETWYLWSGLPYCPSCASKMTQPDPSRSVTVFYADTRGQKQTGF